MKILKLSIAIPRRDLIRFASFSYKNLPDESKKMIDRMLRVDHAG